MGPIETQVVQIESAPSLLPAADLPHEHFLLVLLVAFVLVIFATWWLARWLTWFERAEHRRERAAELHIFEQLYAQAAQNGQRAECARLELAAACKGLELSPKLRGLVVEIMKTEPEPGEEPLR